MINAAKVMTNSDQQVFIVCLQYLIFADNKSGEDINTIRSLIELRKEDEIYQNRSLYRFTFLFGYYASYYYAGTSRKVDRT